MTRTYETLIRLVSEEISENCSKLSPHNSKGVRFRSFQGQTFSVAAGQPLSVNIEDGKEVSQQQKKWTCFLSHVRKWIVLRRNNVVLKVISI